MTKELYLPIQRFSFRHKYYLFFDTDKYLADQLFIRHKVRVWFDQEFTKPGFPYIAIFCHVRKKDVPQFLLALDSLRDKMLLCGYPEYEEEAAKMLENMKAVKGAVNSDENCPSQETKQT